MRSHGSKRHREHVGRAYRRHPLNARAILRRLRRDGKRPPYSEVDLAFDPSGDVTDQNHVGGPASVMALARRAGISTGSQVLDLGCGLGGPARLLRCCFGCSVQGVDLSSARIRDARWLTDLVGVDRVSFAKLDFLEAPGRLGPFDVAWGQSSWSHAGDPQTCLERIAAHIRDRGVVAFEEPVRLRDPRSRVERGLLDTLAELWAVTLVPADTWLSATESAGFTILHTDDLTERMYAYYGRSLASGARLSTDAMSRETEARSREMEATLLARRLAAAGVLGRRRVVAQRARRDGLR